MNRGRGFTLVEVMVALAIVALALPALMVALSRQVDGTGYLRDKSVARLVADNKLAELRLLLAARSAPPVERDSGVVTMADREWYWRLETEATEVPHFFRIEIDVAASEDEVNTPLYSLAAFLSRVPESGVLGAAGGQ